LEKKKKGIEKKTPRAMVSLKRFVGLIEAKAHGIRTPLPLPLQKAERKPLGLRQFVNARSRHANY
jgi:hypothetical protein